MSENRSDLELLWLKLNYPKNLYESIFLTIAFLAICLTFCIAAYLVFFSGNQEDRSQIFNFLSGSLSKDKNNLESNKDVLIQFWTPSSKTWKDIKLIYSEKSDIKEHEWQNVTEQKVIEFSKTLKGNGYSTGWRRYETYSKGRTEGKYGYWWVMTASKDFDLNKFKKHYFDFWKDPDNFYIEIYGASAKYVE